MLMDPAFLMCEPVADLVAVVVSNLAANLSGKSLDNLSGDLDSINGVSGSTNLNRALIREPLLVKVN
jgi:hypothetical protein